MELDLWMQGVPSRPPLEAQVMEYSEKFKLDPQIIWDNMTEHWWEIWMHYRRAEAKAIKKAQQES